MFWKENWGSKVVGSKTQTRNRNCSIVGVLWQQAPIRGNLWPQMHCECDYKPDWAPKVNIGT